MKKKGENLSDLLKTTRQQREIAKWREKTRTEEEAKEKERKQRTETGKMRTRKTLIKGKKKERVRKQERKKRIEVVGGRTGTLLQSLSVIEEN